MPIIGLLLALLGLRILAIARRRGGAPEYGLAAWFVGCGVGSPLIQHFGMPEIAPATAVPWLAFAQACAGLGFIGLYVFTWQTFGPRSGWRRGLALAGIVASLLSYAGFGLIDGFSPRGGVGTLGMIGVRLVAIVWAFIETSRYALHMHRRVRLGLADPVVADRFRLWALWTGSMLVLIMLGVGVRILQIRMAAGLEVDTAPVALAIVTAMRISGLVAALTMWLSFFPPDRYQAWLRAGADTAAPNASPV